MGTKVSKSKKFNKEVLIVENNDLRKQIEILNNKLVNLETKHNTYVANNPPITKESNEKRVKKLSDISTAEIDKFVEEILKDPNVNIGYLPDWVERKIYKNVFTIALGLVDKFADTTSVKFLGHELKFDLVSDEEIL